MKPWSIWLALALGVALASSVVTQSSCYAPAIEDCQYSCNITSCPAGLTCNAEQRCTREPQTKCPDVVIDAPRPDGPPPDAQGCSTGLDCPPGFACLLDLHVCVPIPPDGGMRPPDGGMMPPDDGAMPGGG